MARLKPEEAILAGCAAAILFATAVVAAFHLGHDSPGSPEFAGIEWVAEAPPLDPSLDDVVLPARPPAAAVLGIQIRRDPTPTTTTAPTSTTTTTGPRSDREPAPAGPSPLDPVLGAIEALTQVLLSLL